MIMILGRSNSKRKYGFYANNDDSNEEEEEDRSHFLVVFVLFRYWLAGGRRRAEEFVMRHGDEIGEWRSDFGFVGCGLPRGRWLSKMQNEIRITNPYRTICTYLSKSSLSIFRIFAFLPATKDTYSYILTGENLISPFASLSPRASITQPIIHRTITINIGLLIYQAY